MSYFSFVQIQPGLLERYRWLMSVSQSGETYRDHSLIWKLFPRDDSRRKFVFRRRQQHGNLSYYVVSHQAPQSQEEAFSIQTKEYNPQLALGERVRFDLVANPTVTRKYGIVGQGRRRPSRRHDVLMDAKASVPANEQKEMMERAAIAWLTGRSPQWGLRIVCESILTSSYTQHRMKTKGREIQFSSLQYNGVAEVTDPSALFRALIEGVGHARAFGCGLLLVRRFE